MRAMLTSLVLTSAALAFSGLPAVAGENLTVEVLLPGHEATDAHAPAAAFGKDVYLVAWEAGRGEKADIVAMRLDTAGKPLDPKPFAITSAKDCQERPRVAFGGGVFLVVWQDLRSGKDYDTYAARVSPEGKVLDADGFIVSAEKANQCQADVCFDGAAFQVVWRDYRCGEDYEIWGGRVSPDGKLLDGSGALVQERIRSVFTTSTGIPGCGTNGTGAVIVGMTGGDGGLIVRTMQAGRRSEPPAKVFDKGPFSSVRDPAVASDGKAFLATFTTFRPISRGGTVAKSGAALVQVADGKASIGNAITVAAGANEKDKGVTPPFIRHPAPVWDGSSYVVAWDIAVALERAGREFDAVYVRRISREGQPEGKAEVPVAGEWESPARLPAAATDGAGTTLIAYERHPKTADVPIKVGFRMLVAK